MKHDGQITISRPQYGNGTKKIVITIKDTNSVIDFIELEIDYVNFTEAITGLAYSECKFETRLLDKVGKKRIIDNFEFEMDNPKLSRSKEFAIEKVKKICPIGWECSTYFGSQDSFFDRDGKSFARTKIMKWVEK